MKRRIICFFMAIAMCVSLGVNHRSVAYWGNEAMASGDADVVDAIMMNLADYAVRVAENEADIVLDISDPMSLFVDAGVEHALSAVPVYGEALSDLYSYGKMTAEALWELGEALAEVGSARRELMNASFNRAADHQKTLIASVSYAYQAGMIDYKNGVSRTEKQIQNSFGMSSSTSGVVQDLRENASHAVFWFDNKSSEKINTTANALEALANSLPSVVDAYRMGFDVAEALDDSDPAIKITMRNAPRGNLAAGASFYCQGTISSEYVIERATVHIVNSAGNTVDSNTIYPNKTSVDIAADGLDTLAFRKLTGGSYRFILTAENKVGTTEKWESSFSIVAAQQPPQQTGTGTQYRYHRYIDSAGNVSVCPYYGGWKYNSVMRIEYTEWLNEPLSINNGEYSGYVHQQQGSSCTNAGCIDATCTMNRHWDGNSFWFYEETRTAPEEHTVHEEVIDPAVEPTCTTDGKTAGRHCSVCGEVLVKQEKIYASGHSWDDGVESKAATCTEKGTITYTCGLCFATQKKTVSATGHAWGEWITIEEADYGVEGEEIRICANCSEEQQRNIEAMPMPDIEENPFVDISSKDYYYDAVLWGVEQGVTSGTSATTFSPNLICTRSQVVTFLWSSQGKPEPTTKVNPFKDVKKSDWFYKPVLWAVEQGITSGTSATTFSPNATCTTGQVLTFLWASNGKPVAVTSDNAWYSTAVAWANNAGLLGNMGAFSPVNPSPRAEIITYLYRNYLTVTN